MIRFWCLVQLEVLVIWWRKGPTGLLENSCQLPNAIGWLADVSWLIMAD